MVSEKNRRQFLNFLGKSCAGLYIASTLDVNKLFADNKLNLSLKPSSKDDVILAKGLNYKVLISWGDALNKKGDKFGFNNDYIAFLPLKNNNNEGLMWVNHETTDSLFVNGLTSKNKQNKTLAQAKKEMLSVGGSILHVKKNAKNNSWQVIYDSTFNKRLTGQSKIPFSGKNAIMGSKTAVGTLANCAGGITPWGHFLTCEENYDLFYGEAIYKNKQRKLDYSNSVYGWQKFFDYPPEHYGWVVEVDPFSGKAKKLVSLGRFAHEGALVVKAKDKCVVYMGDDVKGGCFYKFISNKSNSLESGNLYVANLDNNKWELLDCAKNKKLSTKFANQTEMLIRTREAALLAGGTPLDRPEDAEVNPITGHIYLCCTNNAKKKNYYGSILRFVEKNNDHLSLQFTSKTWLNGGPESGFACPDNLLFDKKGNIWMTNDMSNKYMNKGPYIGMGNNGLFFIPTNGKNAGKVHQIASAPKDAEFTGPCLSPDGKTLFLSVQHPGSASKSLDKLTSHWPLGGKNIPKPSVIAIQLS